MKYKSLQYIILTFTLLCSMLIMLSIIKQSNFAYAEDLINYDSLIYVDDNPDENADGYVIYNYGGAQIIRNETLTIIINDILTASPYPVVHISFGISDNIEEVVLNIAASKTLSVNGYFDSVRESGTVITLESGKLYWGGLVLQASTQGLFVNSNANLEFNSGKITILSSQVSSSAVEIKGRALLKGDEINYSEGNSVFGYGLLISDASALVTIEGTTKVFGHTAIEIRSGLLNISAGTFTANKNINYNTSAGFAVTVSSVGQAIITGGTFTSNGGSAVYLRGNNFSSVNVSGGTFIGGIKIASNSNSPVLKLNGINLISNLYHGINIDTADGTMIAGTTLSSDILITAVANYNTNGYRFIGWIWLNPEDESTGTVTKVSVTADDFSNGVVVKPKESNLYTLKLYNHLDIYLDEIILEYGTVYDLSDYIPTLEGYTFLGFSESLNGEIAYTYTIVIDKDYTLYTVNELVLPIINNIGNISRNYDENVQDELTVNPVHILSDVTYDYIWQKKNTEFEDLSTVSNTYTVKNVSDNGIYRVKITMHNGFDILVLFSNEIDINISKADFESISYIGAPIEGTYSISQSLADFVLEDNFAWINPDIIPSCDILSYSAVYNEDSDNYNNYYLDIPINLAKANYESVAAHDSFIGSNYVYDPNKTLADSVYELNTNYHWENPQEVPTCNKSVYNAYYNHDIINYEKKIITIIIQLIKNNYSSDKLICTVNTKFSQGDPDYNGFSLSYINYNYLPEGYSLINESRSVSDMYQTHLFPSIENYVFNDCSYDYDPINYNRLTGVTITIFVAKGDYSGISHNALTGVYSAGKTLQEYDLDNNYSWEYPETIPTCNMHSYPAVYSNPLYVDYYNDYKFSVEIVLEKADFDVSDIQHNTLTGVYNPANILSDYKLNDNYVWQYPDIIPTVDITLYKAVYNSDSVNYNDCVMDITINLEKASYDLSCITMEDKTVVYNGEPHFVEYKGALPNGVSFIGYNDNNGYTESGVYIITIKLLQADTVNYKVLSNNFRSVLTINKAPSVIIADARQSFICDGDNKCITASVNNAEQKLIYSRDNCFFEKGIYTIIVTTTESKNYLAGYKEVTVTVNSTTTQIGDSTVKYSQKVGEVAFGLIKNESGLGSDVKVVMEFEDIKQSEFSLPKRVLGILEVNLTIGETQYEYEDETFILTVLLPKNLQNKDNLLVSYMDSDGVMTVCESTINGNCIVIETTNLGNFIITEVDDGKLDWWAWLLISLAIAAFIAGTGFLFNKYKVKIFSKKVSIDAIISVEDNDKEENI